MVSQEGHQEKALSTTNVVKEAYEVPGNGSYYTKKRRKCVTHSGTNALVT